MHHALCRRWPMAVAALLLVAPLAAPLAHATTQRRLTLEQLVAGAELILLGEVESATAEWVGNRIVTRHTVVVEDVWQGRAGARVVVTTLGGVVGAIGQRVHGTARLSPGDRVLLFLAPGGPGSDEDLYVVGMAQGAFRIAAAGEAPVTLEDPPLPSVVPIAGATGPAGASRPSPGTLSELRQAVEALRRAP